MVAVLEASSPDTLASSGHDVRAVAMSDTTTLTVAGTFHPSTPSRPRLAALSNGKPLATPASINVSLSALSRGDTFSARIPIDGNPPYWFDPIDPTSTTAQAEIDCELQIGWLADDQAESAVEMQTIIQGSVSETTIDLDSGWVTVTGRDYSSRLVDHQMNGQAFLNVTAAQALTTLAGLVGLDADVDATPGLIGQYYQFEHKAAAIASGHRYQTAWDFCIGMQRITGYDLWVSGKTLHFLRPLSDTSKPITLHYSSPTADRFYPLSEVTSISLQRRMLLSRGVVVTISAWDPKQATIHTASYPIKPDKFAVPYTFKAAVGTTQAQLQALAGQRYNEVLAHSRTVTGNVHPALPVTPRRRVRLSGTGTTFDQVYWVDQVAINISASNATKTLTIRNRGHLEAEESGNDG